MNKLSFDSHTHVFGPGQVSGPFMSAARKAWGDSFDLIAEPADNWESVKNCSGAIVLAFDAIATGIQVPNEYVADYVSQYPSRLFGFASVDPNKQNSAQLLEAAIKDLKLSGLKLGPIYQNFYPDQKHYWDLYAMANKLKIPILWHQGTSFIPEGFLDASRPAALDPIARSFPELKMIIAHMGHPWIEECIAIVRKNANMYMDLSALGTRPWQFYNAMVLAMEYKVTHKILFGSDFPFFNAEQTADHLRSINKLVTGTSLPRISESIIEAIIYRNTPELLGLQ